VSFHFQDLLGTEKVYGLNNAEGVSARHQLSENYLKRLCLFGEAVSYAKIASLMAKGAVLKVTNITESFTFEHFRQRYGDTAMPLLYLTKDAKVKIVSGTEPFDFPVGIELISLLPIDAQEQAVVQKALADEADRAAKEQAEIEAKAAAEARKVKDAEEAEERAIAKEQARVEALNLAEEEAYKQKEAIAEQAEKDALKAQEAQDADALNSNEDVISDATSAEQSDVIGAEVDKPKT
jgi:flagellar biosynthesis GTPase FlhF